MHHKKIRRKKLWMLPLSILLMAGGLVCLWLLMLSVRFTMPARAENIPSISTEPLMNRDDFVWIPPTEPEPEPEPGPEPYQLTINLADVQSRHNYNHDIAGWVRIKDTVINYPIMQTTNNSFYTDHNSQGQFSHNGAIFADWRCTLDDSDNVLIYGHNLANGTMLHAIKNYKVADWGNNHRYIEVASLTHRYLYKVLSVNVIYGELGAKFDYWNYIEMNRSDYRRFYENLKSSALVWYGDDTAPPRDRLDQMLVLQTCNSGARDGMRCVVFAQRIGDFTDIPDYQESEGLPEKKIILTDTAA